MDQERKGEGDGLGPFLRLLQEAVGKIVHLQYGEAFLSWMRVEAPHRFPEIFGGLPHGVGRALATELGWQIWNATPLSWKGERPLPLRRPPVAAPCPCRSGRAYGSCCAGAPSVPGLSPKLLWAFVAAELPLEELTTLAQQGAVPRPYLGIVARRLVEAGRKSYAMALFEPLLSDPGFLDKSSMETLDELADAREKLKSGEEARAFVEQFTALFRRNQE